MKRCWPSLFTISLSFALILSGASMVFAQEEKEKEEPKEEFTLDEIIVTAERRETSAYDTPVSVTAWDANTLDEEAINGIQDLQMRMPSTTISETRIYMRGVGRDQTNLGMDPGVGIYEDGFYTTDPATLGDLFDVYRVEAIRGPQSTLFGRNTIGGAVQIFYNRPTSEWSGQAKLSVGVRGQTALLAFGGPLVEDKLMYRVRLRSWEWNGYRYNHYLDQVDGGYDGYQHDLGLLYQPSDSLEIYGRFWGGAAQNATGTSPSPDPYDAGTRDLWYTYPGETDPTLVRTADNIGVVWTRNDNKAWSPSNWGYPDPRYFQTGVDPSNDDPFKGSWDDSGFTDTDSKGGQLTVAYDATQNLTVKFMTEYRDWWWYGAYDSDGVVNPDTNFVWQVPMSIYQYIGEFQVIYGGADTKLSFIAGAFYYFRHETQGYAYLTTGSENLRYHVETPEGEEGSGFIPQLQTASWDGPQSIYTYDTWIESQDTAFYGQVDYQLTPKFNITLGARWARDDKKGFESIWYSERTSALYSAGDINELRLAPTADGNPPIANPRHASGPLAGEIIQVGDFIEAARREEMGYDKPAGTWAEAWGDGYNGRELKALWDTWVGKLSFDYKPTEESLLYLSFSRGFKAGGFDLGIWAAGEADFVENLPPGQPQPIGEPSVYGPELLNAYEIGWKNLWFNDRWRTTLTGYVYDYDQLQVELTIDGNSGVRSMGDAEVIGVEFEGEGYVTDALLVTWAASYTFSQYLGYRARDDAFPWLGEQDISGNWLKNTPEWKYGFGGTYTKPTDIGDFSLNGWFYWQGDTYYDQYNSRKSWAPPWDRLDLRTWWKSPDRTWRISVSLDNVFDNRGLVQVYPGGPADRRTVTMVTPREWLFEVSYKW